MNASSHNNAEQLAQRFLELWQRQLTATIQQPEMVGSMLQMMHSLQQNTATRTPDAHSPAHTAGSSLSPDGDAQLAELHRRVAELETRIAQLEPKPKRAGQPAKKRARK